MKTDCRKGLRFLATWSAAITPSTIDATLETQVQAMAQVLVNLLWFGMDVQAAIEAPRYATYSFPSSFAPNDYHPGLLMLEQRLGQDVAERLRSKGHDVRWWDDWAAKAGGVCAIVADERGGSLRAGADPRRAGRAAGK